VEELDIRDVPSVPLVQAVVQVQSRFQGERYSFAEADQKVSLLLEELRKALSGGVVGDQGSFVYEPNQLSETDYIPTPAQGIDIISQIDFQNFHHQ